MKQGKYLHKTSKNISEEALGKKKLIPKNTLVMSFKLSLGKLGIIKKEMITKFARSEKDTGSPEVQIALLTQRINHLTEHFKVHKKEPGFSA